MSRMTEVKTAELSGPALDWAVAEAEGIQRFVMGNDWPGNSVVNDAADSERVVICNLVGRLVVARGGWSGEWKPSSDWSQGGPLIDKRRMSFEDGVADYYAVCAGGEGYGPTHLVAACRSIVSAALGDTVQVPSELTGGAQ